MPHSMSVETVTFALTETEILAYYEIVQKRQAGIVGRSQVSFLYVPLALGVLLMIVSAVRGGPGRADFGPMLIAGAVGYLSGVFAYRHEVMRAYERVLAWMSRKEPLYHGTREVTLRDDAIEVSAPSVNARYGYAALSDVEVQRGLILGWIGNDAALLVPTRAFASASQAEAFAAEARSRVVAARATTAGGAA
jgi:hypothetical protein